MTSLAVSIAAPDADSALAALHQAAPDADLAELRVDLMHDRDFELASLLEARLLPVIVTCRPQREGGRWQGSETSRLNVLRAAADFQTDYIDLEWDAADELASFNRHRSRFILSRHDFTAMPANLPDQAAALWAAGADVVKLVGYAHRLADILPVLELLQQASGPTIAIAMGGCGLATRLLGFRYPNALLSFATLDAAAPRTAPGQISLTSMNKTYRVRSIGPDTRLVGWLAEDANDAPEVAAGNGWLAARGIDARLIPLQHAPDEATGETLVRLAQLLPLAGCLRPAAAGLHCWTQGSGTWAPVGADVPRVLAGLLETEPIHGA